VIDDFLVGIAYGRDIEWQDQAACNGLDVNDFFPEKGESPKDAKRICGRCPVRRQCLAYALDLGERFGIYGGTSERERRRLKREGQAA
jgi:WhiB family transcriptional regulator, redox-sensing transcriptional regulator